VARLGRVFPAESLKDAGTEGCSLATDVRPPFTVRLIYIGGSGQSPFNERCFSIFPSHLRRAIGYFKAASAKRRATDNLNNV